MRDPAAGLRFEGNRVLRDLREPLDSGHFLRSDLAIHWVADGRLVPFEWDGDRQIVGRRLPFVSQPAEWCDAQLFAAARLTLDLQREAVERGFDLKDASAWNVLFDGCRPMFCDLLSFKSLTEREWWAFGQYGRHFLLPLLASRRLGFKARESFTTWRDGMPVDKARQMIGWRALLSRYGTLLAGHRDPAHSSVVVREAQARSLPEVQAFRGRLHAAMSWQLDGLRLAPGAMGEVSAGWAGYQQDRPHYGKGSLSAKRRLVGEWLARSSPSWVLDLGCNTGEFSELALTTGAEVIALDADHDSIQRLFLAHMGKQRLHPLVAPLDDLRGGRGWGGEEHPGLAQRLQGCADIVLMLALVHHLAIGASVPLDEVARFACRCTRGLLIVELLESNDPQLVALCKQRQRAPEEFTLARQRDAFLSAGFAVVEEHLLDGAARSLLLLSR